ncbi:MAG TPA: aminotransferase class V-fold PLP-dependent enzyme [Methylibium sp.]|uniref:pyridoxal phosphate-dependent decarboxylase family protein n=1 Tax=Methylibium sp. TaxID=2067992 RepID=UPI002DC001CA|nr:aminotransferase class V-fold PLP-dependent enzyme [Methylibium sp.]HEU4459848.1 aminotransferase class V-fold PLP-dependent enzyme [Methylibium sp.]
MELDADAAARRDAGRRVVDALVDWQERRAAAPIFQPTPPARIDALLATPPPEPPGDLDALLATLLAAADGGWNKSDGGDLAYVPSGGLASGALAALLAAGLHPFTGACDEAPALVALEEGVLRWLAGVFGLPAASEGLLLSGGSLANQTAIVCAREACASPDGAREAAAFDATRHVAYLSERAHHSLAKALRLAGVPAAALRQVATDGATRIDLAALRAQIAVDRAAGRVPWLVVGTAGSTDTGAIDDLAALAAIAREAGCWFHVDAAYGGMFALTARGRERLAGIDAADSITVDAHKGLFLPYGVSALLVRRPGALGRAHAGVGAYQRGLPEPDGLPHYFQRGPELTRPFRGLLLWLPLQLHGVAAFRAVLDRSLDLAQEAALRLARVPGLALAGGAPALSIVAFRATAGDVQTQAVVDAMNGCGRLHVSSTTLFGHAVARLAFLHPRTTRAHLDEAIAIAERTLAQALAR